VRYRHRAGPLADLHPGHGVHRARGGQRRRAVRGAARLVHDAVDEARELEEEDDRRVPAREREGASARAAASARRRARRTTANGGGERRRRTAAADGARRRPRADPWPKTLRTTGTCGKPPSRKSEKKWYTMTYTAATPRAPVSAFIGGIAGFAAGRNAVDEGPPAPGPPLSASFARSRLSRSCSSAPSVLGGPIAEAARPLLCGSGTRVHRLPDSPRKEHRRARVQWTRPTRGRRISPIWP